MEKLRATELRNSAQSTHWAIDNEKNNSMTQTGIEKLADSWGQMEVGVEVLKPEGRIKEKYDVESLIRWTLVQLHKSDCQFTSSVLFQ